MRNVLLWIVIEIIQKVQIGKVIIGYHGEDIKDFQIQQDIYGVQWVAPHVVVQAVVQVVVQVQKVVVAILIHYSKFVIRKLFFRLFRKADVTVQ
jgi:hypothetical protein